ncbi:unnamed protein product [Rhizophagus irregularis]|uniref:HAT C-terminal dimerisation domain-containing protein n=1 Tax=Rhizophagus irregularis TaxID=588596 RepID=A0A916EDY2_9GLOM|nr:unnamed protein product [Rhizophagus irregularis]
MHEIIPHNNANCEKVFSILGWFLSKQRTKIDIERLQAMVQIHSYLVMNTRSELKFLDSNITSEEINETLNQISLSINNGTDLFDENNEVDFAFENINEIEVEEVNNNKLKVTNFVDLSASLLLNNNEKDQDDKESIMHHEELNFDVDELINQFDEF